MAGEINPFVMARCGGSQRTAICPSATSTGVTTAAGSPSERLTSLSGRETRSSCAQLTATLPLRGDGLNIATTDSRASNAACSATKGRTSRRSLSDRLTRSLIDAGLVCGTTPSSIRQLSGQPIRVLAFDGPDGGAAASPAKASSSLSVSLSRTRANRRGEAE